MIKIYRLDSPSSEPSKSIDHAILTAIFNSKKPDPDKWLKMAMSWDRADIARRGLVQNSPVRRPAAEIKAQDNHVFHFRCWLAVDEMSKLL